ncbi:hypothetical protein QVD99_007961 [Batrachochytrium dendrobatidis]|nr:hypothetical protein O5D80_004884 [Batrachochytrium dendrobatidis]KAK5665105.1 hypothetical protein QVD99_007961 [Batrachochytrium dendrobatidis]
MPKPKHQKSKNQKNDVKARSKPNPPAQKQQHWLYIHSKSITLSPCIRVSLPLAQKLGKDHFGQWCIAITLDRVYYGKTRACSNGLNASEFQSESLTNSPQFTTISTNISRAPTSHEISMWEQKQDLVDSLYPVALMKTLSVSKLSRALRLVIEIVHLKQISFCKQDTPVSITPNVVLRILVDTVVSAGCTIDDTIFNGNYKVKIHLTETLDGDIDTDVIVHKNTNVDIYTPSKLDANQDKMAAENKPIQPQSKISTGSDHVYKSLLQLVTYPLRYAKTLSKLNIDVPKAVLLSGPPGVGKTSVVSSVAEACQAKLFVINASDVFGGGIGESEERLRQRFDEARKATVQFPNDPVILFIDEIDVLAPRREGNSSGSTTMVAQFLTLMDGMMGRGRVFIVAATNRSSALDPALRRPGRFDREIVMNFPSESQRLEILRELTKKLKLSPTVDLFRLSVTTIGYVGADLAALCREAALLSALSSSIVTTQDHFDIALKKLPGASVLRGTRPVIESTRWDAIGGLESVKLVLRQAIEWPILYKDTFKRLGLRACRGILMYGPPGCSKTTLVRTVASTSNASFFTLNTASLYSAYLGDSERIVRSLFQRARSASPAVVFIDEVDTIIGKRSMGTEGTGDAVQERILSSLLNEMDGIESAAGVLVLAATNRPDLIDEALLRPGRFDRVVYVPPPSDTLARQRILEIYTTGMLLCPKLNLEDIASQCEMYTGADLKSLCREAALCAIRSSQSELCLDHFLKAMKNVLPTLSVEMMHQYQEFSKRF